MRNSSVRRLCRGAVTAGLYAALTLLFPAFSYGPVQVRPAEALCVLPFFFPEAVPGLAAGCLAVNLLGSPYALDWLFGTAATLAAACLTRCTKKKILAPLPPVLVNAAVVGAEIAWYESASAEAFPAAFAYNAASVALGEAAACYGLGMLLMRVIEKHNISTEYEQDTDRKAGKARTDNQ